MHTIADNQPTGIAGDPAQRSRALVVANDIRHRRSELKRELKAGRDPIPVILSPPEWAEGMLLAALLMALPRMGRKRTRRILNRHGVSTLTMLGEMSEPRREKIAAWLVEDKIVLIEGTEDAAI